MQQKKSIWLQEKEKYPAIEQDMKVQTIIIGGGLSGLSTAYYLSQQSNDFILVEAYELGSGVSGKTTAHITFQHDDIWHHYIKTFGLAKTRTILQANKEAIEEIHAITKKENIDCDFHFLDSVLFSKKKEKDILKEYQAAQKLGIDCSLNNDLLELPFETKAAMNYLRQATFNPIKYLLSLVKIVSAKGVKIFEDSQVSKVGKDYVIVNGHKIEAKNIILATHNPIINFPGLFFSKHYYQISNVIAGTSKQNITKLYNCLDSDGFTYRPYQNYMLFAGCDYHPSSAKKCYRKAEHEALKFGVKSAYYWSAMDGTSLDKLPYIGKIKNSNFYIATGFGKWGMTNSNIAGRIISDLILNKPTPYARLFAPDRRKGLAAYGAWSFNLLVTMYHQFVGLWQIGEPRCSHLKCRLHYQKETETYDCPCHGSMFDQEGQVIDGPAKKSIKARKKN